MEVIRPQIDELLADEFIERYHIPQTQNIRKQFNKLYDSVKGVTRAYVKPLLNGSGIHGGNIQHIFSVNNYRHLM